MINVAILDDHQMFVDGIGGILQQISDITLLGISRTEKECFALLSEHKVDLLLNDVKLETEDGIAICEKVKSTFPNVKVLMLSMFNEISIVRRAFNANADGYLLKSSGREKLLTAIKEVNEGRQYIDNEIQSYFSNSPMPSKTLFFSPQLSKREKEVLQLIIQEYTTAEIANLLYVSPKTIESHRSNLLAKFGVRNIAGLVRKTLEFQINLEI